MVVVGVVLVVRVHVAVVEVRFERDRGRTNKQLLPLSILPVASKSAQEGYHFHIMLSLATLGFHL